VSLPWNVTAADIDAFAAAYVRVAARLAGGTPTENRGATFL
jgi:hypothetical protein